MHPHDTVLFNRLELANEYAMFLFGYSMLIFTGLERPVGLNQFEFGRVSALLLILFVYVINIGVMIHTTGYELCLRARAMAIKK